MAARCREGPARAARHTAGPSRGTPRGAVKPLACETRTAPGQHRPLSLPCATDQARQAPCRRADRTLARSTGDRPPPITVVTRPGRLPGAATMPRPTEGAARYAPRMALYDTGDGDAIAASPRIGSHAGTVRRASRGRDTRRTDRRGAAGVHARGRLLRRVRSGTHLGWRAGGAIARPSHLRYREDPALPPGRRCCTRSCGPGRTGRAFAAVPAPAAPCRALVGDPACAWRVRDHIAAGFRRPRVRPRVRCPV